MFDKKRSRAQNSNYHSAVHRIVLMQVASFMDSCSSPQSTRLSRQESRHVYTSSGVPSHTCPDPYAPFRCSHPRVASSPIRRSVSPCPTFTPVPYVTATLDLSPNIRANASFRIHSGTQHGAWQQCAFLQRLDVVAPLDDMHHLS